MGDEIKNENQASSASLGAPVDAEEAPIEDIDKPVRNRGPSIYQDWESTRVSEESLNAENRDTWGNQWEFLMTCLSTAVGLGNVWRFPFTAYDNGGGAFLVPFFIVLFGLGTPLYFLEMSVGQFCTRGPIGIWDMAPIGRGIGWAFLFIAGCTVLYYISILAICQVYLVHSFSKPLPWKNCYYANGTSEWYATEGRKIFKTLKCFDTHGEYQSFSNPTQTLKIPNSELFFKYAIVKQSDNIDHGLGAPTLTMSISLYIIWTLVFLNVMLGTKSSGKCAYFTALFPYFVLFVLAVKAMTLDGAVAGISYFFKTEWEKVMDISVWFSAVSQIFFSLGVGYGVITTFGSYNPTKRRVYKDVIFICLMDTFTSIVAGITVFAILGVLAKSKNVHISDVTAGGTGLAFVSYPEILLYFNGYAPQVFAVLFFLMLMSLGIGSGSAYITAICGTVFDRVPFISNRKINRIIFTAFICVTFASIGLIFATPGGIYMVDFFDLYSSGFVVYAIVIFQIGGIAYIYGMKNFTQDLLFMFGGKGYPIFYKMFELWGYVIPIILLGILAKVLYGAKPLTTADGNFPLTATLAGWALFGVIVLTVPAFAIGVYRTRKSRSAYKRWKAAVSPTHHWGPKNLDEKIEWENMKRGYDGETACWKKTLGKCCRRKKPNLPGTQNDEGAPTASGNVDVSKQISTSSGMRGAEPEETT